MTFKRSITSVFTMLIFTCCETGYKVEGDKVFFQYWNEGSGQGERLIEQADATTFKEFTLDCDCNFEFGKDKNHVFINGELIEGIDPDTFEFIGNYIFRDKDSAYFFGFYNALNDCVIKGVNPDKIKLIQYPWAKADNFLIHGADTVRLDDVNDFIPINDDWGKSRKYIVNNDQILYGADVETFKITSSFQGKDKNHSYEFGIIDEDDFKATSYKTFDFDSKYFCELEPLVFIDIYDKMVSFNEDQSKSIELVEKLKSKGFSIGNTRHLDWGGESKIIRVSMNDGKCDCIVEKLYRYDYSKPSETKSIFKVTERILCERRE